MQTVNYYVANLMPREPSKPSIADYAVTSCLEPSASGTLAPNSAGAWDSGSSQYQERLEDPFAQSRRIVRGAR